MNSSANSLNKEKLINFLDALKDKTVLDQFKANPRAILNQYGVQVPADKQIELIEVADPALAPAVHDNVIYFPIVNKNIAISDETLAKVAGGIKGSGGWTPWA
jgi:hypothetical protein